MKHLVNLKFKYLFTLLMVGLFSLGSIFGQWAAPQEEEYATLVNFSKKGLQITRFDSAMAAIDAHDGEIQLFDGVYYLYGTSYDCGYEWQAAGAPFCGFKTYSSRDLMHWKDEGFMFDAQTDIWQERCDGSTYGCYRPHVIYNKKNNNYVLWINVYDNRTGFRVFTSPHPAGPFTEIAEPTTAVNNNAPLGGLNNGDHDTFVDDDGTAYLAYTDWRTGGTLVIDELNEDYTSGTGRHVKAVTSGSTEAPCLTKRGDTYYILYSDPNCGYCTTGTSYKTASSPLGPWSGGVKLTETSCGGQPAFVSVFELEDEVIYLYGSDLWNNGARNEALANYFWVPLAFNEDGSIKPITCETEVNLPIQRETVEVTPDEHLDSSSGSEGFTSYCDINVTYNRGQSFVATRSGMLTAVSYMTSKSGHPEAGLTIEIYKSRSDKDPRPTGKALSSNTIPVEDISWSPRFATVNPNIMVEEGVRYVMIIKTTSASGCYGMQYNEDAPYPGGGALYSSNRGASFVEEKNRTLMFQTFIDPDATGVSNVEKQSNINVYPNPVEGELNISLDEASSYSGVKIFDSVGKEVLSQSIGEVYAQNTTINVSSLNPGFYIVKLDDGASSKAVKIVKQ